VQDFCPDCKDLTPDEETEYEVRQREYRKTRDERKKRRTVEMRRKKQVTVITVVFTVVMFAGIAAVIGMVGTRVINGFVSWPTVSIITAFGAALGLLDALKK
jgi:fatty acid desaturase